MTSGGATPDDGGWSERDSVLWYTCDLLAQAEAGRVPTPRHEPMVAFPPRLAAGERMLASGPFVLSAWGPAGDGSYTRSSGFFFATGGLGLALTGAVAAGRAVGNARRRARAEADRTPRWHEVDRGALTVSSAGFYLETPGGLFSWDWASVTSAQLVGPDLMRMTGNATDRAVSWLVQGPWVPLLFELWCLNVHPGHPQRGGRAWLPAGWQERATTLGRPPALLPPA